MKKPDKIFNFPKVDNYYAEDGLEVKMEGEKYYWGMEDYGGDVDWQEIPKYLYSALLKHYEEIFSNIEVV